MTLPDKLPDQAVGVLLGPAAEDVTYYPKGVLANGRTIPALVRRLPLADLRHGDTDMVARPVLITIARTEVTGHPETLGADAERFRLQIVQGGDFVTVTAHELVAGKHPAFWKFRCWP